MTWASFRIWFLERFVWGSMETQINRVLREVNKTLSQPCQHRRYTVQEWPVVGIVLRRMIPSSEAKQCPWCHGPLPRNFVLPNDETMREELWARVCEAFP
jgi:hypothetical protein